jgi:hypothetical protein
MCQVSGCKFLVTATRRIGLKIRKGDQVLIDADATPTKGCYVVGGDGRLERWKGQAVFHGVAVAVQRAL